jgi:hypothetical protein
MHNQTILNRMMKELTLAKEKEADQEAFLQHISHIRLLCDLFLDSEDSPSQNTGKREEPTFSQQELEAMLGNKKVSHMDEQAKPQGTYDHDGANGKSIFDF